MCVYVSVCVGVYVCVSVRVRTYVFLESYLFCNHLTSNTVIQNLSTLPLFFSPSQLFSILFFSSLLFSPILTYF